MKTLAQTTTQVTQPGTGTTPANDSPLLRTVPASTSAPPAAEGQLWHELHDEPHHTPIDFSDHIARSITKLLRFLADAFFARRYGNRAVVLETIAAVPGMVGGALVHLRCLRRMQPDNGWIMALIEEAENERMHLMTFIEIAKPSLLERMSVMLAQGIFYNFYFLLYLVSSKTAHRLVGYFEEEAVFSYTEYLNGIDAGVFENVPAPQIAIDYWKLPANARLRDVVLAVRRDEAGHRDVNHNFANQLA